MNNPKQHLLSSNPSSHRSSIKSRFTIGFLRALIKMKKGYQPTSSSSRREVFRRYRKVKIATDKSMAVAVGSRRAWSRAMLLRFHQCHHRQTWRYRAFGTRRNHSSYNHPVKKRLLIEKKKKNQKLKLKKEDIGFHHQQEEEGRGGGLCDAGKLRKLVPGGEAMDICSLLDETAHYIKCLVTQVEVMRRIDEFYSI